MVRPRLRYLFYLGLLVSQSLAAQKHVIKDNPMDKLYEASKAGDKQGSTDALRHTLCICTCTCTYAYIVIRIINMHIPLQIHTLDWSSCNNISREMPQRYLVGTRQRRRHQQTRSGRTHCAHARGCRGPSGGGRGVPARNAYVKG